MTLEPRTFSFDQDTYPADLNLFVEYRLVPGDILDMLFQIVTWEQERFTIAVDHTISVKFVDLPELNETQNVRPDGRVTLPYVGDVEVLGKTVEELTEDLQDLYTSVLRNPEIYVTVPDYRAAIKELKKDLHTAPRGLSRLTTVRPDGYVTFPMVGDIFAAHRTIPEVDRELQERYEAMLPGLNVDLFLERHAGSTVYVLGEVLKPGEYRVEKPITVFQAITLASGHLPSSDLTRVVVFRRRERSLVGTTVNVEEPLLLRDGAEAFYLKPDDIVVVPKDGLFRAAEITQQVQQVMMFRGWSFNVHWDVDDARHW